MISLVYAGIETPILNPKRGFEVGEELEYNWSSPLFTPETSSSESVVVWREEIIYPNASYISPHFSSFNLPPGAYIEVKAPDGSRIRRYTHKGKTLPEAEGFWGIHIRGEMAIIELYSSVALSAGAVQIDAFAKGSEELFPFPVARSVCQKDNAEWAPCYRDSEPEIYENSRAVVRLLINGTRACTGWLVGTKGHLLTNWHCISSRIAAANTDFEFMAEGSDCNEECNEAGACPGVLEADSAVLIKGNPDLDYVLLRLPVNVSEKYGHLNLRLGDIIEGERVYMPQHGLFWGKRISVLSDDGFVEITNVEAPSFGDCPGEGPDLAHNADTEGGSSGSPVIAYSDHRVVGLNHCNGDCPDNLSVPIDAIIEDLGDIICTNDICESVGFPDQWDPDDDISERATMLPAIERFVRKHGPHTLSGTDIHDWFAVELSADVPANFNSLGGTGDLVAELYDDIAGEVLLAQDDNSGDGRQFSLSFTPPDTKTYYLKVMVSFLGRTGTYQLSYSQDLPPLKVRMKSSSDDAEEQVETRKVLVKRSSDLELGEEDGISQIVGIRFPSIDIPAGETIVNAHIQFTTDEVKHEPATFTIYGEGSMNAATFSREDGNISSRPHTTASVSWEPRPWLKIGEAGLHQQTPNLANILQEIRDLEGWSPGQPMTFLIEGKGTRTAVSYDGSTDKAPQLIIELSNQSITPANQAPEVDMGEHLVASLLNPLELMPLVKDDGLPLPPGEVTIEWMQVNGPEISLFSDSSIVNPTVRFFTPGIYEFQLSASDGVLTTTNRLLVRAEIDIESPKPMTWLVKEHFNSIQEAIDSSIVLGRDRILIEPGTYNLFTIPPSRPNLTISGTLGTDGTFKTNIDADDGIGIHVFGSGSVIENLIIMGGQAGIVLEDTRATSILRCLLEDHLELGIGIVDSSKSTIMNCSLADNRGTGISILSDSENIVVFQSTFADNGRHGISIKDSENLVIAQCEFIDQGLDDLFIDDKSLDVRAHDNRFLGGSRLYIQNENDNAHVDATCNIFPLRGIGQELVLGNVTWQPFRESRNSLCITEGTKFEIPLLLSSDDAEEHLITGSISLRSTDLELGKDINSQIVGLRFNNVKLPPRAQILGATIQFTANEVSLGVSELTIFGEASDHSEPFKTNDFNISSRSLTMANIDWTPDEWTTKGNAGFKQKTPHLTSIIQEIIDHSGWQSGNALSLIIVGGTSTLLPGSRVAESIDGAINVHGDITLAPALTIEYVAKPEMAEFQ